MWNVALWVAYDGTDFVGSQWQNNGRSVQGELEGAWQQLTQEQRRATFAGRTDAGVHAQGQVVNIQTETQHSVKTIQRGLNAILPEDIVVKRAQVVDREFHARYSAIRREYRYLIDNTEAPSPLLRHHVLHVEQPLDVQAMNAALSCLEGRHDFAAFATVAPDQKSTVRQCFLARCNSASFFEQRLLAIDLMANAFLHHMVRVIVGTVLLVGRGRATVADMQQILESKDRRAAGPTVAAHGLTLVNVVYPVPMLQWVATHDQ